LSYQLWEDSTRECAKYILGSLMRLDCRLHEFAAEGGSARRASSPEMDDSGFHESTWGSGGLEWQCAWSCPDQRDHQAKYDFIRSACVARERGELSNLPRAMA